MPETSSWAVFGSAANADIAAAKSSSALSEVAIDDREQDQRLCRHQGRPERDALVAPRCGADARRIGRTGCGFEVQPVEGVGEGRDRQADECGIEALERAQLRDPRAA